MVSPIDYKFLNFLYVVVLLDGGVGNGGFLMNNINWINISAHLLLNILFDKINFNILNNVCYTILYIILIKKNYLYFTKYIYNNKKNYNNIYSVL